MEMQTEKMGFSGKQGVEEEDGVDLSLCLSIGGSTSRMAPKAEMLSCLEEGEPEGSAGLLPSSPPPQLTLYHREAAGDRRRRREMQLLRRQEAHAGIRRRRNGATLFPSPAAGFCNLPPSPDDRRAPENKEDDGSRISGREEGLEDAGSSNQKTGADPERGLDFEAKPELLPNANGSRNADVGYGPTFCRSFLSPNLPVLAPRPYPVMAMQSPFLQLQCLQVANGFEFPYWMPWWVPAMRPAAPDPATSEVRPFPPPASSLAGKAVVTGGWMPQGSSSCSAISDHASHSFQDIMNEVPRSGESSGGDDDDVKRRSSHHAQVENPRHGLSTTGPAALPQMPCVSTTGKGPNGRTITGLLYRYTAAEVSIVCVCHGTFFSPAEFVKHAGGTEMDAANPLRHITVVPF